MPKLRQDTSQSSPVDRFYRPEKQRQPKFLKTSIYRANQEI